LNYLSFGGSGYDQVDYAIADVGAGASALKLLVVDVEPCCVVTTMWQSTHRYRKGQEIADPEQHMQVAIKTGTSGSTAPNWNDSGGTTNDGTVVWKDWGTPIDQAQSVDRICQAVKEIQSYKGTHLTAVIYTDRNSWSDITGNLGNGTNCPSPNDGIILTNLPLWDVEHTTFLGSDGQEHCGDGVTGLLPFDQYRSSGWQARSGDQLDFGLVKPPKQKDKCNGQPLFGISAYDVDLDYFDPILFR